MPCFSCSADIPESFTRETATDAFYRSATVNGRTYFYRKGKYFCSEACLGAAPIEELERYGDNDGPPVFVLDKNSQPTRFRALQQRDIWQKSASNRDRGYYTER